jgi:quinol-cytochrome oxidoreductase complex cytochrome b subunit
VILVLTGTFLTFFYRPNIEAVTYTGSNPVFVGRSLPAAFESIVRLSSDVNGGLLFRRLHRGASHLFIATIVLHMLRVLLPAPSVPRRCWSLAPALPACRPLRPPNAWER